VRVYGPDQCTAGRKADQLEFPHIVDLAHTRYPCTATAGTLCYASQVNVRTLAVLVAVQPLFWFRGVRGVDISGTELEASR
jgi:hypothetical protein